METGHVSVRLEVTPEKGYEQVLRDTVLTDELQIQVIYWNKMNRYKLLGNITRLMA